jgi:FKBP-type peptidyl-prolyl cis-trans isomerase FklB
VTLRRAVLGMLAAVVMAIVVANSAAQETSADTKPPEPAATDARPESMASEKTSELVIHNRREKVSYALGVALARDLRQQGLNLDLDIVTRALRDAVGGNKLLITEVEALATLKTFEEERKQDLAHAKKMISEKNRKAAEVFFAENLKKEDVVTLPSGLQYKVIKQGDGKKPALDDKVVCHYRGTLLDGTEFNSTYKQNEPVTLPVTGLIKGWSEALQLMPAGSKWELFVPPQLAYGERGSGGGVGPNAMLVFEVELISVETGSGAARRAENNKQEPVLATGGAGRQ